MEFSIRAHDSLASTGAMGGDYYHVLVVCPPSWDTWVGCDSRFQVPPEFNDPDITRYEVVLRTLDSYTVDYDVDNLSILYIG